MQFSTSNVFGKRFHSSICMASPSALSLVDKMHKLLAQLHEEGRFKFRDLSTSKNGILTHSDFVYWLMLAVLSLAQWKAGHLSWIPHIFLKLRNTCELVCIIAKPSKLSEKPFQDKPKSPRKNSVEQQIYCKRAVSHIKMFRISSINSMKMYEVRRCLCDAQTPLLCWHSIKNGNPRELSTTGHNFSAAKGTGTDQCQCPKRSIAQIPRRRNAK